MLKFENHSLQALILVRHVFINGIWKFRVGLMGAEESNRKEVVESFGGKEVF